MPAYLSNILSGSNLNVRALETAINTKLPARRGSASTAVLASMASTTFANRLSTSITGVETDDVIVTFGTLSISGTASERARCDIYVGGAASGIFGRNIFQTTATDGAESQIQCFSIWQVDVSGTVALDLRWALLSGSNTIYSADAVLQWLTFKRR